MRGRAGGYMTARVKNEGELQYKIDGISEEGGGYRWRRQDEEFREVVLHARSRRRVVGSEPPWLQGGMDNGGPSLFCRLPEQHGLLHTLRPVRRNPYENMPL